MTNQPTASVAATFPMCPAAFDVPDRATWRCNLLAGHVGVHDTGIGDRWADDTTTDGPDRLRVAAVNLLGSYHGIDALRDELVAELGEVRGEVALQALGRVLRGWKNEGGEP